MPVINYQGAKLDKEQKEKLIKEFTAIAVEVTKTPAQFFSVMIQDFEDENMGVGGKTVEQIKAERA